MTDLTSKDFRTDQEVRWCPGCGDYAILAAVQSFMPELGLARENIVFVSWGGRDVTTLRGRAAARFLLHADGASAGQVQELLRRATGNFKHGNER